MLSDRLKAEIDRLRTEGWTFKQTFCTRTNGRTQILLLTSTNSLSNAPWINVGTFENEAQGREVSQQAFEYATRKR